MRNCQVSGRDAPARVLIADDNADMREYLARLLRGAGYHVDAVTDGQQALDADPRRRARPGRQRRDDAPAGRTRAGRGAAGRSAHRGRARAAVVRPRRAGGVDRGAAGRRRRLPRQAVRRRRTPRPGAGQHRAGAAAQPPCPLAHGAGRLAAGGVLRLRRAGRGHRDQRRVHRHPRLRRRRACPTNRLTRGGRRPTPTPTLTGRSRRPSPSCSTRRTAASRFR